MTKTIGTALLAGLLLAGCNSKPAPAAETKSAPAAATPELTVAEVAAGLHDKKLVVVDANGVETRQQYGTLPGAVLLSNHDNYALSELPNDKAQPLVFYCGGVMCRASDKAATRAVSAGYAKVSVMREGIKGWAKAGQPTETFPKS